MRNSRQIHTIGALTVLGLGVAGSVRGGPPFVTDDPEPVDYQHWEIYIASQDAKLDGDWSGTAPHFELNYGVVSNVQLHLIAPLAYDAPPAGAAHYGYGDTELGVKFRFLQETDYLPQAAIFPLVEAPTGSAADNLGDGYGHWCRRFCQVVAAKKLGNMDGLWRRRLWPQLLQRQE